MRFVAKPKQLLLFWLSVFSSIVACKQFFHRNFLNAPSPIEYLTSIKQIFAVFYRLILQNSLMQRHHDFFGIRVLEEKV